MKTRGDLIAAILTGAWRRHAPDPTTLAADVIVSTPWLLESGVGPLAWWRIRESDLAGTPGVSALRNAYRLAGVWAILHQRALRSVMQHLRDAGIDAIVVKGWAAARSYPEPGLRIYSDHDVLVRRADAGRARDAIAAMTEPAGVVDLHAGSANLDERPEAELFDASDTVDSDGVAIRVLAPEDHLRVLCRHALRHGLVRPLWLCDVAAAVESRGPGFDWTRCLTSSPRVTRWVISTLGLAHAVLGMSIEGTPAESAARPPQWAVATVQRAWGLSPRTQTPVAHAFGRPAMLLDEVRRHWPNGLQATFAVRGPINNLPRWPFQLAACVPGAWRVLRDLRHAPAVPPAATWRAWTDR